MSSEKSKMAPYPPSGNTGYPQPQFGYTQPPSGQQAQYGYPQPQGGYPPTQGAYQQSQGGYPQPQGGQPQGPGGYPQPQGGYPQPQGGYQQSQGGYPPATQYAHPGYPPATAPGQTPSAPSEDVSVDQLADENFDGGEVKPSAPPLSDMTNIQGYSNVNFDGAFAPPPSYDDVMKGPPPENRQLPRIPEVDEQDLRDALLQFVSGHCCYGKGAAEHMCLTNKVATPALHYMLESFGEQRQTAWAFEPYRGQPIDGPENGVAPGPWDIALNHAGKFCDYVTSVEVPHTANVKACHQCHGMCMVRCHRCYGRGQVRCSSCHGTGHKTRYHDGHHERTNCTFCHGRGRKRCVHCHGNGMVQCQTCLAVGKVKWFIKLTVNWKNHVDDFILEKTDLPDELIRNVSGELAFEEEAAAVWPINHFPDNTINDASQRLVNDHRGKFPTERILMQRQKVRLVPVTEVACVYKNKPFRFFVYGFENQVHAPEYPQQCCCGCTIL